MAYTKYAAVKDNIAAQLVLAKRYHHCTITAPSLHHPRYSRCEHVFADVQSLIDTYLLTIGR